MAIGKRNGRYWVSVYRNGERVWLGTFDGKREAQEVEANARLEARNPSAQTVRQFEASWLDRYPRPKESTHIHYRELIRGFVKEWGDVRLRDLSRAKLRKWAVDHPAQAQVARTMLSDAHRDGLILENPLTGLRLPQSRGRRDLVALTDENIVKLVQAAEFAHGRYGEVMYGPMIELAAATGVRPGELYALRWQDVDLDARLLSVSRQYNHRVGEFTSPKNGRSREVELIPAALKALRRIPRTASATIFRTKNDRMFTGRVSYYYWHPVRVAYGDPEMDFYGLRHAYGTMLARMGIGAPAIAAQMGHTDGGKLALERYIHMLAADARSEVRRAFERPELTVIRNDEEAVG